MTDLFDLKQADLIYQDSTIALCHEGFVIELYATKREIAEFLGYHVDPQYEYNAKIGYISLAMGQGVKVEISPKKEQPKPYSTDEFWKDITNILNPNK